MIALESASARIGATPVLHDVSLTAAPGELVALCGPNGAGKTSVLRAALGLLPLAAGEARLGGDPVGRLPERVRAERAGWLPQARRIAWNLPAVEVAALGAPHDPAPVARAKAMAALEAVGAAHLADRGVAEMSGGERARVLFARFLATGAPALLADEPAAGLDPDAQLLVMELLRARAAAGAAVLVSLHDLSLAARQADRVVVLKGGAVVAAGRPAEALAPPVLADAFGLEGRWLEGPDGPLLSARRR